ncbi:hypothetical protein BPC006_I2868 [Burkholderia pseudomallei BPC006]|nr:hypothetical protein BPC006_I2868 [Burkholderia pseudomallei BPC006]
MGSKRDSGASGDVMLNAGASGAREQGHLESPV